MTGSLLPLRVQDLTFEAGGKRLLEAFSFELSAATRSIILGPNGAGKSLTLRLCHGFARAGVGFPDMARRRR